MRAKRRLTKTTVEAARHRATRFWLWDAEVRGFGLRVSPKSKVWTLQYRDGSRTHRLKLGEFPALSVIRAREIAAKHKVAIAEGRNPARERRQRKGGATVRDLVAEYLDWAESNKRPRSVVEDRRYAEKLVLPRLGHRLVEEVTSRDVARLHQGQRGKPTQANRLLAFVSALFAKAEEWELRQSGPNPAHGIKRFHETARNRHLSDYELARLGHALREEEQAARDDPAQGATRLASLHAIQLLLLTGSRRSEILGAKWEWIDWEQNELVLPELATKAKREHRKPLAPEVIAVLEAMGVKERGLLFPSPRDPSKAQVDVRRVWAAVCKRAGLRDAHLHDLRRTLASVAADDGVPVPQLMSMMGWTQLRTAQHYVHRRQERTQEHLRRIGSVLTDKLNAPSNVVPLRSR